jgi:hypothetical protein
MLGTRFIAWIGGLDLEPLAARSATVAAHLYPLRQDQLVATHLMSPANQFLTQDYTKGSSLALPYIGKADSEFITDYGNAIQIPAPGIDKPAPAWALSPSR